MDWGTSEARLHVLLAGGMPGTLTFHGITSLLIPKAQPWGPSNSINETKTLSGGQYAIEMQSGDVLEFKATSWSFSIEAAQGEA